MELRLISYNIHKGFDLRHRKFVLEGIKAAIQTVQADIVFLQEVVGHDRRHIASGSEAPLPAQFEYLADQMWPHFAYGRNAVYDNGHHGNAILSRYPILSYENFDISIGKSERRGVLHCLIDLPGEGPLDCFCTHLELFSRGRAVQFEKVCREVAEASQGHRLIIAGDFNDWERRACSLLEERLGTNDVSKIRHGRLQRTFPTFWPIFALDRIYSRGFSVKEVNTLKGEPWRKLSDHLPIFAVVETDTALASPA